MTYNKFRPRVISNRDYKHFNSKTYAKDLLVQISKLSLRFYDNGFTEFFDLCKKTLDQYASWKQKYMWDNHMYL